MKQSSGLLLSALSVMYPFTQLSAAQKAERKKSPNIIYIMADDMGIGDLGCYGQTKIKTPAIDKLAANGMRFTHHYAGCTVSAPSRCSLMTGKHTGHSYIRGNHDVKAYDGEMYDHPLADEELTVAELLKTKNYVTACIGKWGMGGPGSEGHPNKQGFDYFFGYLGQLNAHRYFPRFLWENDRKIDLDEKQYSHDMAIGKALNFIDSNAGHPFFLYLSVTIPHADLQVPDGELGEYDGMFDESAKVNYGGYYKEPKPKATFAAMVSRLDRDVQRIVDLLEEKGLTENTVVVFTSDNGTHREGGHDPEFFNSNGGFRGIKRDLYEGGIRTPFIVSWPGTIKKGRVCEHVSAFWDFMPTVCELAGVPVPKTTDGISYLSSLTGKGRQKKHDDLYFEFHEGGGKQAIIKGDWKLIRLQVNNPEKTVLELYNLKNDPAEQYNLLAEQPSVVKNLEKLLDDNHRENDYWKFIYEQNKKQ